MPDYDMISDMTTMLRHLFSVRPTDDGDVMVTTYDEIGLSPEVAAHVMSAGFHLLVRRVAWGGEHLSHDERIQNMVSIIEWVRDAMCQITVEAALGDD